ncbi:MAG: LemA family protein [Methanobacteriota archaeon]|nr:MAG: LemA family protein [Euryarchaeota archaeon]
MLLEIAIAAIVVLVILWVVATYNKLVRLSESISNAWAQIDVELKRRADLIPNLVNTVKGYMKHERGTLERITELRSSIVSGTPQDRVRANNMLTDALKSLFAVAENYPDLKANQNFLSLQGELSSTENRIASARSSYNNDVVVYNKSIKTFPAMLVASLFKFNERAYLEADEKEREAPKVSF